MLLNCGDGSWPYAGPRAGFASTFPARRSLPHCCLDQVAHQTENTGSADHKAYDNSENLRG